MMRKYLSIFLCVAALLCLSIPAYALPSAYFALGKKFVRVNTSGSVTLPVRLTYPASGSVTVNLTVSGTVTNYDSPDYGTEYVSGKPYSISASSVTFAPGETSKTVTLNILERKTFDDNLHIPFYQETACVSLEVDPADISKARTASVGNKVDVLVSDATLKGIKNVKDYGATGNGTTNDQTAIQNAITAAAALITDPTSDQAVVYFPKGNYRIGTNVTVPAGITLLGEDKDNTIIKRFGRSWFVSQNKPTEQKAVFVVSGINTSPSGDAVYADAYGNRYVYYSSTLTGTPKSGTIYFARVADSVRPPTSGILTKISGTGDATITFSKVTQACVTMQVTGVTVKPTEGSVYTNNGSTYTYFYDHISSGSGALIMEKTQGITFATNSQPLVKQSGVGDSSISISSTTENGPNGFRFTVSGVTNAPAVGDTYQDSASGMGFTVYSHTISGGSGQILAAAISGQRGYPAAASGTLAKLSGSGDSSISFSTWDGEGRWWNYMLVAGGGFNNAAPSALSGIRNLTIHGNWDEYPEYRTLSYTLYEGANQLSLSAGNNAGQYRFLLENVLLTDGITTHLSTVSNSRTYIYNTRLQDSTAYKGKFSLVGGHNDMFFRQSQCLDADSQSFTNLDIEQNTATGGYYGDNRYTVTISDSVLNGITQFSGYGTGTRTFAVTDSVMGNLDAYADTAFTAIRTTFNFTEYGSNRTYIYGAAQGMQFTDCVFNIYPDLNNNKYPGIRWYFKDAVGATYTFTNCTFNKAGTHNYGDGSSMAFYNEGTSLTKTSGYLVFEGCTFNNLTYALWLGNGGNVSFKDCVLSGVNTFCRLYGYDPTYNFKATFENIQFNGNYYLWINGSSYSTGNEIAHTTDGSGNAKTILAREHARIKGGTDSHNGQYLLDGIFSGKRLITGDTPPTAQDPGLLGDEFKVGSSYWNVSTSDKNNAGYYIWRSNTYDSTVWTAR